MTKLTVEIDGDLHKRFSKAVIDEDTTKAAVVRTLVAEWTAERRSAIDGAEDGTGDD